VGQEGGWDEGHTHGQGRSLPGKEGDVDLHETEDRLVKQLHSGRGFGVSIYTENPFVNVCGDYTCGCRSKRVGEMHLVFINSATLSVLCLPYRDGLNMSSNACKYPIGVMA
jgi:hypothetical protein